ncbi:MAG: hypothetical protein GYA59_12375 [Chloroflexi bacterium]|nr:hypothetical protein [Chloroflexota bacterium]
MTEKLDLLAVGGPFVFDRIAVLDRLPPLGGTVLFPGLSQELEKKHFGGCIVNVAVASRVLGLAVGLAGFIGKDFESSGYRAHLDRVGIMARWLQEVNDQDIAHCYSFYDPQGTKLSFMDGVGSTHPLELTIPDEVIRNARRIVLVGGSKNDSHSDSLLDIAMRAGKAQVPVALAWAGGVVNIESRFFKWIDTLLCNHYEIESIRQHFGLDPHSSIPGLGLKNVFVTSGSKGSDVYSEGRKVHIPVVTPEVFMDPTGAGDSYAGGVLAGMLWGKTPEECGRIGAVVSSFVVEKKGCQTNLPSRKLLEWRYRTAFGETLNKTDGDQ